VSDHTHEDMHGDHHQARLEHLAWMDDIRQWRLDHRRALIRIQALVDLHEAEMDSIEEAIEDHEMSIEDHEMSIEDHEAGGAGRDHNAMAAIHEAEGKRHKKMAQDLETMKRKHQVFVDAVDKLLKEMEG
jgi:hypothetical protein